MFDGKYYRVSTVLPAIECAVIQVDADSADFPGIGRLFVTGTPCAAGASFPQLPPSGGAGSGGDAGGGGGAGSDGGAGSGGGSDSGGGAGGGAGSTVPEPSIWLLLSLSAALAVSRQRLSLRRRGAGDGDRNRDQQLGKRTPKKPA